MYDRRHSTNTKGAFKMATIQLTRISVKRGTIHCEGCASRIKKALRTLPGVISIEVDIENHKVIVRHDADKVSHDSLREILDNMGYPVIEFA